MRKNIVILDHVGNKAGMDYYSGSLAKGLLKQGCYVFVYSNFTGIESDQICYKEYFDAHTQNNALVKIGKIISATFRSAFHGRRQKADLVIIHLFSANILTLVLVVFPKLFGLKTAVISHDVSSFLDNDQSLIQHLIYNVFSHFVIVHNRFSLKTLVESVKIKDPEKVVVIKHGGYLDHIGKAPDKEEVRRELGLEPNTKYILFFGQIKKVKGLDILLKAMADVSEEIKLIIAGKLWKDDFSIYETLIDKYGLQDRVVKMIRFIEDSEREKLFYVADVNVLPYRLIYQSGVLLMAMSHGLPVIASDLPPNKEVLKHEINGLLFESENVLDLVKQINLFFQTPRLEDKLKENASLTIQNEYNWTEIAKTYVELIN